MTATSLPLPLVWTPPRAAKPPRHLADLTVDQVRAAVAAAGHPAYRAEQLSRHYFHAPVGQELTAVPTSDREGLGAEFLPALLTPINERLADRGTTRKTLWRAFDGTLIESVLMRYPDRATLCVSSQAGCGMACPFCATGQGGLTRNLSAGEIVDQVVWAAKAMRAGELPGGPGRLSNIVFMGMGEPLANYNRVLTAIRRILAPSPHGLGMSARGITVSTVGLVPAIDRLADEGLPLNLAVSLHAPDDELRDTLVPVNTRWPVRKVLDAAWRYADVTGRRVSIEYALIRDVNDSVQRADQLGRLLSGRLTHVNVIPLNPTPGSKWDASSPHAQDRFVEAVRGHGVPITARDTRGREIDGACGQLAASVREDSIQET
ncbi:MAG: 23S rRNA (adenine(2503)-C(2))-methyltransferase RlmN [Geodermatophilaceae bacterium]|nr:23S rRNA (adenine(2503)-C(2))-methyltransferase RlmN [Geodermatophilaceae bacterium]MDQ3476772.1 23S rRNA (adenine(2503)-C(2))-methyltransferase RlmN [Actinomycetota bacterium]